MKYILVATLSGLIGFTAGFVVWGTDLSENDSSFRSDPIPIESERTPDVEVASTTESNEIEATEETPVAVETLSISTEQQSLLQSFGIDSDGITVTADMIDCAERTLGKERLEVIVSGATPTFFESARLLGCYKP